MNPQVVSGSLLAVVLLLFGGVTAWWQWRGRQELAKRKMVPSDERAYFARRYRRRFLTGVILCIIGLMIGGAFLTGMERRADHLGEARQNEVGEKAPMAEEDRQFVRFWGAYWIVVLVLVFVVIGMAFRDAWATRRYWLSQYRQISEDHQTKLRRDLAVYKQHKQNSRGGIRGNRLPDDPEPGEPDVDDHSPR
jgi:MFS family permease